MRCTVQCLSITINIMCAKSGLFHFSNSPTDFEPVFDGEKNPNETDCICGPKPCKPDVTDSDEISLDSADEAEVAEVSLWESIIQQSKDKTAPYREWLEEKEASEPAGTPQDGPAEFLDKEIFPLLLPAMRIMLMQAREWDALKIQKCRFNGLDFLAEVFWNRNPRHPKRSRRWLELFSIPPFRLHLKSKLVFETTFSRPGYKIPAKMNSALEYRKRMAQSWLWSREEGALMIQKWVRGWLVRKRDDVQEMREFWKVIIAETESEAAGLGMTYSELVEHRRQKRATPCERHSGQ